MPTSLVSGSEPDAVVFEAIDFLLRLTSGEATTAEARDLAEWRARDAANEDAFREVARLWRGLGRAAKTLEGA